VLGVTGLYGLLEGSDYQNAMSDTRRDNRTTIGFVVVSHGEPAQLSRLITALNEYYEEPPIAVHHDIGQQALDGFNRPENVYLVDPSLSTGWAKWSVIEAALRALALLYEKADPDWFFLLSAADYPCMNPSRVRAELASTSADAFLDVHHLFGGQARARLEGDLNPQLTQFLSEANRQLKWNHYVGAEFWVPILRRRLRGGYRLGRYTIKLPFSAPYMPFGTHYGCFFGDHWFTGNRKVAQALLATDECNQALRRHFRFRAHPDEGFYQTVLCNRSDLVICKDNKRFAEWNGGGAHPMTLTTAEIPRALASGAYFARKFAPNDSTLDFIDERLRSLDG
jgi:hypothetical protein